MGKMKKFEMNTPLFKTYTFDINNFKNFRFNRYVYESKSIGKFIITSFWVFYGEDKMKVERQIINILN